MTYAKGTVVSVDRSRTELERMLSGAGASQRGIIHDEEAGTAYVVFRLADRHVRLHVPLPKSNERRFELDGNRRPRPLQKRREAWEQACRERWRLLVLLVKAKLEAIAAGVTTVEREFLADIYLADGRTVHQAIVEPMRAMYEDGQVRPLLLGPAVTP